MKVKILVLATVALIAACGGSTPPECLSSWACPGQKTNDPPQSEKPPATSSSATVVSVDPTIISANAGHYLVQSGVVVDLTVDGSSNNVTFDTNQASGAVVVNGDGNILIFRQGATVQTLTVTGESNTIWIPAGSSVGVSGTMPSSNTVKRYTP